MYRRILVPLDGSELAECVFPHVQAIASGCNVPQVVFIRVVERFIPPVSGADGYAISPEQAERIEAQDEADAQHYLSGVLSRVNFNSVKLESAVLHGRVAEMIADYAGKHGFDLVIMATHGRSGVSRWVWGSVTDRVLRSSCIPILMVRAPGCVPGI